MRAGTIVKARIPTGVKNRAIDALEGQVAVPNRTTRKAIEELKAGKGKRFASKDALFKDLGR